MVELKNTPENAPQAPCCVSRALNREETLVLVLAKKSSEEDLLSGKREQALSVPVANMQNQQKPDIARNSEQVGIPVGLDWIKNQYYNFKMEVGQFLPL